MHIQVILASTRPGRVGERVANWVMAAATQRAEFKAELVDLKDYELTHFDEPGSPKYNPNRPMNPATKRWTTKLAAADAYIIVTPEYNHSIPGVLKDALDFVDWQLTKKPVAIVSYGSIGGARAAEHLRQIVNFLGAAVVPYTVTLANPTQLIDEHGVFVGPDSQVFGRPAALQTLLDDLSWWARALKDARAATPKN